MMARNGAPGATALCGAKSESVDGSPIIGPTPDTDEIAQLRNPAYCIGYLEGAVSSMRTAVALVASVLAASPERALLEQQLTFADDVLDKVRRAR